MLSLAKQPPAVLQDDFVPAAPGDADLALHVSDGAPLTERSATQATAGSASLEADCRVSADRLGKLRRQVARLTARYQRPAQRVSTGWAALDRLLGGGLWRGAVHELLADDDDAPTLSVALRAAASALGPQQWLVYLDAGGELYPPALTSLGAPLEQMLVVRVRRAADVLWACEQALRCRATGAVVADVRRLDALASRRLQLAAEQGAGFALLLCSGDAAAHKTFAATRLRFELAGGVGGRQRLRTTLLKQRAGAPRGSAMLEWPDAPDLVSAPAAPGDGAGAARRQQRVG